MLSTSDSDIFVLVNPNAGIERSKKFIHNLQNDYPEIDFYVSKNFSDALDVLQKKSDSFTYCIVAGGDGTINQLLPFFVKNTDKVLCVYPAGSGNGFALETGFKKDFTILIEDILKGQTLKMDVCVADGKYAVNMTGIGLDGYVADLFQHQQKRGLWKYIVLTTKALISFIPFKAKVHINGQTFEDTYWGIVLANVRQFGNHAYIAPMANPFDGLVELVLVKKIPFYKLPEFLYRLFNKKLRSNAYLQYISTSGMVRIETDYTFGHRDGEPFHVDQSLSCKVIPEAITILKTRYLH